MKKFFMILTAVCGLMVSTVLTTGCQYDDDDVWSEIENVKGEIDKLKTQVGEMQTLIGKLEANKGITNIEETEGGYLIHFTDNTTITIKNGENGADGEAGSQIGVKEDNGIYYWTVDGEFLMINDEKVAVTGNDGHTPVLSIDNEGYWCVDGTRILVDEKPIPAQGDSFFQKVEQKGNEVIFTLADGSSFNVPMSAGAVLAFEQSGIFFTEGERVLNYQASGVTFVAIDEVPAGISAVLNETTKSLTITMTDKSAFVSGSRIILKAADKNGYAMLASVSLLTPPDFLMVNEGWFGHESGSVCAYNNGVWDNRVYQKANDGATLGVTTTVGVQNGDYIYFVSKDGVHLAKAETATLKKVAELKLTQRGEQGMNFAGVSDTKGYLTTGEGVYEIDLNTLALGKKVFEGTAGDIFNADGKIYFIGNKNIYSFDSASDAAPTKVCGAVTGFTRTGDYLWAADNNKNLIKINIKDNSNEAIPATGKIVYNSWAYTPSCLCASNDGKYVFFASGKNIMRMEVATNEVTKLYTNKLSFYGQGLSINPKNNELHAITFESWGSTNYKLEVVNHETGEHLRTIDYSGTYWFPSSFVFLK